MKLFFFLSFLTISVFGAFSQTEVDSLMDAIKVQKGQEKVQSLLLLHDLSLNTEDYNTFYFLEDALLEAQQNNDSEQLGNIYQAYGQSFYYLGQVKESLPYYFKAYQYRSKLKDIESKRKTSWTLGDIGNSYGDINMLDSAMYFINMADQIAVGIQDSSQHAILQSNLGYYYYEFGFIEKAFEHHLIGIEIRRQINDPQGLANSLNNIGYLYRAQGELETARDYYSEAVLINLKNGYMPSASRNYHNLGTIYYSLENLDSALLFFNAALEIRVDENLNREIISTSNALASVHMKLGEHEKAKQILDGSLSMAIELGITSSEYKTRKKLAEWYFKMGDMSKANQEATLYLNYARENNIPSQIMSSLQLLAEISEKTRKFDQAFLYLKEATVIKDSLNQLDQVQILEDTEAKYKNKEISLLNENLTQKNAIKNYENNQLLIEQKSRNRNMIMLLIFLVIVAILASWLWMSLRNKKKLNTDLSVALGQRDLLLKEIHHRVKNNLQTVSSLLSLQSRYLTDAGAQKAISESQNRLNSISLLHQHLYQKTDLPIVSLKQYLEDLVSKIKATSLADEKNVSMELDCDDILSDIDLAMPLGLIINEIVTNSFKHAFQGKNSGLISLKMKDVGDNHCELTVKDDGVGSKQELDQKRTDSLGVNLIQLLIKQIKGEMTVKSNNGVEFFIKFRIPENKTN